MKFDDLDYHAGEAEEAGYPAENGFTHIGLYLAWLIRHDLHNPEHFPAEHVAAVRSGDMAGSDLADHLDDKLMADDMTAEGASFSAARYDAYLANYEREFAAEPSYSIEDDAASYARIAPAIDREYGEWVAAGRPRPTAPDLHERAESTVRGRESGATASTTRQRIDDDLDSNLESRSFTITNVENLPRPHVAPELERLLTDRLGLPAGEVQSSPANRFGSSLLNRALKRLGVNGRDATVVFAIAGTGEGAAMVSIYAVPGIDGPRLETEFADAIHRPSGRKWAPHPIVGRTVHRIADAQFEVVYWAIDGLVFHVGANVGANVAELVGRLMGDH